MKIAIPGSATSPIDRLADSLCTSREIILAIIELTGEDEAAVIEEWREPSDPSAIIERAKQLRRDPRKELYWGGEGRIA
jgi:hypothetical protein